MSVTTDERTKLIEKYAQGYAAVAAALDGITERELDTPEAPGEWSPRQVVHHLGDSEMTSAIRLRRLVAEDDPVIQGYDQELFARVLFYDRPIESSLQAFRFARESTAEILRGLPDGAWARSGQHTETGRLTVEAWLGYYADHAHDHAEQVRRARAVAARS